MKWPAEVTATPRPCLACPTSVLTQVSHSSNLHPLLLFLQDCKRLVVQTLNTLLLPTSHLVGGKTPIDQKSLCGSDVPPPVPSRTNHSTENLLRDNQVTLVSVDSADHDVSSEADVRTPAPRSMSGSY